LPKNSDVGLALALAGRAEVTDTSMRWTGLPEAAATIFRPSVLSVAMHRSCVAQRPTKDWSRNVLMADHAASRRPAAFSPELAADELFGGELATGVVAGVVAGPLALLEQAPTVSAASAPSGARTLAIRTRIQASSIVRRGCPVRS
jgi:hypothetical protein